MFLLWLSHVEVLAQLLLMLSFGRGRRARRWRQCKLLLLARNLLNIGVFKRSSRQARHSWIGRIDTEFTRLYIVNLLLLLLHRHNFVKIFLRYSRWLLCWILFLLLYLLHWFLQRYNLCRLCVLDITALINERFLALKSSLKVHYLLFKIIFLHGARPYKQSYLLR